MVVVGGGRAGGTVDGAEKSRTSNEIIDWIPSPAFLFIWEVVVVSVMGSMACDLVSECSLSFESDDDDDDEVEAVDDVVTMDQSLVVVSSFSPLRIFNCWDRRNDSDIGDGTIAHDDVADVADDDDNDTLS